MLVAIRTSGPLVAINAEMTVALDHPGQVAPPVFHRVRGRTRGRDRPKPHERVVHREVGSLANGSIRRDELPTALREESVIGTRDQVRTVAEPDAIRGLPRLPMREDASPDVPTIVSALLRSVNLVA